MSAPGPVPDRGEFRSLWKAGAAPPVWREVLADCETPVSAFRKIDAGRNAFLLESVEGGEVWGRYSILAGDVRTVFRFKGGRGTLERDGHRETLRARDPLAALREVIGARAAAASDADSPAAPPPPFRGGAVGWMNYDAVRHYAPVERPAAAGPGLAESVFLLPESWIVFDRLRSRAALVAETASLPRDADPDRVWHDAAARLDALERRLAGPMPPPRARADGLPPFSVGPFDLSDRAYMAKVERAKEYIRAGDVIQVVLSRKREGSWPGDPLDVYRALRLVNPSPYMFYLRAGAAVLAGSSPEALVRVDQGRLTTRPIAGTRPRSGDPAEDARRAEELKGDEKERAEHLMLVDLGRNDLGRVARIGSVAVPDFMRIERYSHVMHLVSDVTAELAPGKDAFDAVASVFPAGTLSGAPKIRAMQIVAELEGARRGPYGGLVGWFDAAGNADTCIGIRMVAMHKGRFRVQAGAGIVYDSDPAAEARETEAKAAGTLRALEMAAGGLDGPAGAASPARTTAVAVRARRASRAGGGKR